MANESDEILISGIIDMCSKKSNDEPKWSKSYQITLDKTLKEAEQEYKIVFKRIDDLDLSFYVRGLIINSINIYRKNVLKNMKKKNIKLIEV